MPPPTEPHMHRNVGSIEDKLVRIVEDRRVTVCRAVGKRDGNAGLDGLAVDDCLLGHGPGEASVRTEQPHKLLDSGRDQTEIFPQEFLELLVFGEVVADAAEHQRWCHHPHNETLSDTPSVCGQLSSTPPHSVPNKSALHKMNLL